jgi:hypothetical protein
VNRAEILADVPATLRNELLDCYERIVRNYAEQRWEPAELNGGKFSEVAYSIVNGAIRGTFPASASKPSNMVDACRALEGQPADPSRVGDRSLRILIPRILPVLYEIRNNRGVGHVGGDVDPSQEDSEAVLAMATWVLAELVRIFHGIALGDAQVAVESIIQRRHPLIWSTGSKKRVLDPSLSAKDQVLLLLYSDPAWVTVSDLRDWIEYSNPSLFKTRILGPLHKERLVEYDPSNSIARITPRGIHTVESELL